MKCVSLLWHFSHSRISLRHSVRTPSKRSVNLVTSPIVFHSCRQKSCFSQVISRICELPFSFLLGESGVYINAARGVKEGGQALDLVGRIYRHGRSLIQCVICCMRLYCEEGAGKYALNSLPIYHRIIFERKTRCRLNFLDFLRIDDFVVRVGEQRRISAHREYVNRIHVVKIAKCRMLRSVFCYRLINVILVSVE